MARKFNRHNMDRGAWCRFSGMEVTPQYPSEHCPWECRESRVMVEVVEVVEGELVDLITLPLPVGEADRAAVEREYATVVAPVESGTPGRVILRTDLRAFELPPDHKVALGPRA